MICPLTTIVAGGGGYRAREREGSRGLSGAEQPGHAQTLAGAQLERDVVQLRARQVPNGEQWRTSGEGKRVSPAPRSVRPAPHWLAPPACRRSRRPVPPPSRIRFEES